MRGFFCGALFPRPLELLLLFRNETREAAHLGAPLAPSVIESERQISNGCLFCCCSFFVCLVSAAGFRVVGSLIEQGIIAKDMDQRAQFKLVQMTLSASVLFLVLNMSVGFFTFVIQSKSFRHELVAERYR